MNVDNLARICVVDSHPGSGKTSWAIDYINQLPEDTKVLFITPFLKECTRIQENCPKKNFQQPDRRKGHGYKPAHFLNLLKSGKNIASTHSLFSGVSYEMLEQMRIHNYILILDEVMNVVSRINVYDDNAKLKDDDKERLMKQDIKTMLSTGIIKIAKDYMVQWVSDDNQLGKYEEIKELANRKMLYMIDNELLIWTFPIEVFREGIFNKILILTYMFDFQIQAYYYNYFKLQYQRYHVKDKGGRHYEIFETTEQLDDLQWRGSIIPLIHICDNQKLNKIGSNYQDAAGRIQRTALSKSWYERASGETIKLLNQNIGNYYKNITKAKAVSRMWTCFKIDKKLFRENKEMSSKAWVELNARATNDYSDRSVLVYPINRFLNPFYEKFFGKKHVSLDQDMYALSELIQWIWRSAIRNGEEIWLYIPSQRMRELLVNWLNEVEEQRGEMK